MGRIKCKDSLDAVRKIIDLATNLDTPGSVQVVMETLEARKAAIAKPREPVLDSAGMASGRD